MATSATSPARKRMSTFPLKFFLLAFAFTWFFWWLAVLDERNLIPLPIPAVFLGAFGPMVGALAMTARESGRAGIRSLLGRVVRWRVAPVWYGVAIFGPLLLQLGAMALHTVLGGQPPDLSALIGAPHGAGSIRLLHDRRRAPRGDRLEGIRPSQAAGALQRPRLQRDSGRGMGLVAPPALL